MPALICIDWMARSQNGKLPDGAFLNYYAHYLFYCTHYLPWLNRIVGFVAELVEHWSTGDALCRGFDPCRRRPQGVAEDFGPEQSA
jgi:hypothetical protein